MVWNRLDPGQRALAMQIVRYGVTGLGVTLFQSALYWIGIHPLALAPLVAHAFGTVPAVVLGYVVHSRFSFRGHGRRDDPWAGFFRFVAASLIGIGLNTLWVWLMTGPLALPEWTPILAYLFVTPAAVFAINRAWVFR